MIEWFVALVLCPVVNWPVEVFYQHESKDLCSLQTNRVELESWPRESFRYHADKISKQSDTTMNSELPLCWQREVRHFDLLN